MIKAISGRRLRSRRFAILAVVAAATVTMAACGGGGSAAAGGTKKQRIHVAEVAYADCMRSHGVPSFPDPDSQGNLTVPDTIDGTPQYTSADHACRHLLPMTPMSPAEQSRELARGLRFSACMRTHGIPGFPDPTVDAQGIYFRSPSGPRPDSTQYDSAQRACASLLTGGQ